MPQSEVLAALHQNKGQRLTVSELALKINYSKGSVSRSVMRLLKAGMIESCVVRHNHEFTRKDGTRVRVYVHYKPVRYVWV